MATDSMVQRRILVVEDDADLRETLSLVLSEYGYAVESAASLDEALELVDRQTFGFIVSDLLARADDTDRLHAVDRLRERAFPTPVGIVTGWKLPEAEAAARGFAWVLSKPFDVDHLVTEIAARLEAALDATQERQAEVVRAYFTALAAHDWDALLRLCAQDVAYVLPPPAPFASEVRGKEAFRRYTEETYRQFPAVGFDQLAVYALPDALAARYLGWWRTADGQTQRQAGAVIMQFEGDRIKQIGIRLNAAQLRVLMNEGSGGASITDTRSMNA